MIRLKELRKEKGLTQKELSKEIAIPLRTLQSWENEESQIKNDKVEMLANYFNVTPGYLLGYNDSALSMKYHADDELEELQKQLENNTNQYKYLLQEIMNLYQFLEKEEVLLQNQVEVLKDFLIDLITIMRLREELESKLTMALLRKKQADYYVDKTKGIPQKRSTFDYKNLFTNHTTHNTDNTKKAKESPTTSLD